MNYRNVHIVDACVYPETEFAGFAEDYLNSGLTSFFLTVPGEGFREAARSIARMHQLADNPENHFAIAKTYEDLEQHRKDKKISGILYFQDPTPVENSFESLRIFYELGIRVVQLSYNRSSYMATGCVEKNDAGLTEYGRLAVEEMNRIGMVVDLSHCSWRTITDAIQVTKKPVLIGHANIYALTKNPRNKDDAQLKMLAENGGVLGLTPWAPILWNGKEDKQPTIEDYMDHIDYAVNLMGEDHVGIASDNNLDHAKDFAGISSQTSLYSPVVGGYNTRVGTDPNMRHAKGFEGVNQIENLIQAMEKRNYSESRIEKIIGANFVRVFKEVWK